MKSTLEVLTEARDLISDPSHFCTRALAQTAEGVGTDPLSDDADKFCGNGIFHRVTGMRDWRNYDGLSGRRGGLASSVMDATLALYGDRIQGYAPEPLGYVNNVFGHDAVMDVLGLAIDTEKNTIHEWADDELSSI